MDMPTIRIGHSIFFCSIRNETYNIVIKKPEMKISGFFAEEEGIEPPLTVLETAALPLYYSSILENLSQRMLL